MFSKFLKRRPQVTAPFAPAVPDGVVVWAVGDIHGRLDLLVPLIEAIKADLSAAAAERKLVIFLGDYVDRGPESQGVVRLLAALSRDPSAEWHFLKGNHEETMVKFLTDPSIGPQWCEYGGEATLRSYGLRIPDLKHRVAAWTHVSADLAHKLTPPERAFLEDQALSLSVGDYFFAHAGARPGEALDRQSAEDLMWIRRSFLDSEVEFEKVVVHGHTPTAQVHADHRRIGIDTRAYDSGVLTGLRLFGRERLILQAIGQKAESGSSLDTSSAPVGATDVTIRTAALPIAADLVVSD